MAATAPLLRESERFGYLKPKDVARLEEAYRFSEAAHAGQTRQSGDPYISHPLAVAEILAGWHLDGQTLMAALLHDVTEDTSITKDEISDTFGRPVADLVDGVSKLDRIEFQSAEHVQAENFRKMLLAMARDVRVILIKLADRLHNMRTLGAVPPAKRRRIARETMEIYAPIANRLGLNTLYHELQELAFAHLYPMRYRVLARATKAARGDRREMIGKTLDAVNKRLADGGIDATVQGRELARFVVLSRNGAHDDPRFVYARNETVPVSSTEIRRRVRVRTRGRRVREVRRFRRRPARGPPRRPRDRRAPS